MQIPFNLSFTCINPSVLLMSFFWTWTLQESVCASDIAHMGCAIVESPIDCLEQLQDHQILTASKSRFVVFTANVILTSALLSMSQHLQWDLMGFSSGVACQKKLGNWRRNKELLYPSLSNKYLNLTPDPNPNLNAWKYTHTFTYSMYKHTNAPAHKYVYVVDNPTSSLIILDYARLCGHWISDYACVSYIWE